MELEFYGMITDIMYSKEYEICKFTIRMLNKRQYAIRCTIVRRRLELYKKLELGKMVRVVGELSEYRKPSSDGTELVSNNFYVSSVD